MKKTWSFLRNPFLFATRNSYEKAVTISTFTDAALQANTSLSSVYAYYHPMHLALLNAYNAWKLGGGQQKGATASLNALIKGLTAAVNDWDFAVQQIYRKGTPEYMTIFPQGHAPFTGGKQDMRISAVATLSNALATISPVPAVKTDVDAYLAQLTNTNTSQKGKESVTNALSENVETARVAACDGLYYVLGKLMQAFYANPANIADYFKLDLIREERQEDFTGHVPPESAHTIAKRTLDPDEQVELKNTGLVPLTFYLSATNNGMPVVGVGVSLNPGEQTHVPASSLGNAPTDAYLTVYNASAIAEGEWEVDV